eukprot:Lithocolla_globosa_v1_NODE_3924_length_1550_cov_8.153846.p1 type:complete len:298 gc:universal NODE_3924_length_1550_cov_8.153846:483-1376(+)
MQYDYANVTFEKPSNSPGKDISRFEEDEIDLEIFVGAFQKPNLPVCVSFWIGNQADFTPTALQVLYGEKHPYFVGRTPKDQHFLPLDQYLSYCKEQGKLDDSPLYIWHSPLPEGMRDHYILPPFFLPELFQTTTVEAGESSAPQNTWLLVGPTRSGARIHQDPAGTSAWNALLHGRKRWVMFPPFVPKSVVESGSWSGTADPLYAQPQAQAAHWFANIYPKFQNDPELAESLGMIEFIQSAGEVVFIPSMYWHVVLNLAQVEDGDDLSIAVTKNFIDSANLATASRISILSNEWKKE